MPYSIQTADDITIDGIPDNIAPDAPELKARVQQARHQRQMKSPEFQEKLRAKETQEWDRLMRENAADMNPFMRPLVNLAAGYTNLLQGANQAVVDPIRAKLGMAPLVTDEDVREKRRADEYLARTGMDKLYQVAGEAGPLMIAPTGAVATGYQAVKAAPVVGRMLPSLGRNTQTVGAAATGGAATSALSPITSDESRGTNAALGGTISAAFPVIGIGGPATAREMRKLLTEAGAERRALEFISDQLGDHAPAARGALADYAPITIKGRAADIPTTAAQATGDARLAQLEAYSRSRPRTQPDWADFDSAQNAARYGAVQDMAPNPMRVERLEKVRAGRTAPLREAAMEEASRVDDIALPLLDHTERMLASATSANPAVRSLGTYIQRELGTEAGAAVTPQRLYEVRKVLAAKLDGAAIPGDELSAAAKGARKETRDMIAAIDDTLETASDGGWTPYLREYVARSKPIAAARSLGEVAEKIADKAYKGNTPEVTAAGYSTALRQNSGGKFGDKLTPDARADADAFLDSLRAAEAPGRTRKGAATMGGGSITNTDQALAAMTQKLVNLIPGVGGYAQRITEYNREEVETHIMRLMQSPTKLGAQLRDLSQNQRSQLVDETLTGLGIGAASEVTR